MDPHLKLITETNTKVEVLIDRCNRDFSDLKESQKNQNIKLESITKSISDQKIELVKAVSDARIEQIKDATASKVGVAALSGTMGALGGFLLNWIRAKI